MTMFGGFNDARTVFDPSYPYETAATQAVIHQLDKLNRQVAELRRFLAEDLGEVLVGLYRLLAERLPVEDEI